MIGEWREFVTFFSRRSTRYGTFSVVSVIVVLAILTGLNYIAGRQYKRWDLTSNQQFTLSEQTTKILKGLKEPLTMIGFDPPTDAAVARSPAGLRGPLRRR